MRGEVVFLGGNQISLWCESVLVNYGVKDTPVKQKWAYPFFFVIFGRTIIYNNRNSSSRRKFMRCNTCSNGAAFGNKSCLKCLAKARERSNERYKKMKQERKCKTCFGSMQEEKGIYCKKCKQEKKDTYTRRKQQGLCVTCGSNKATTTQKCDECHQAYLVNVNAKKQKRLSEGRCAYCENKRINGQTCLKHYLQITSQSHFKNISKANDLYNLFLKQNGICPYTGKKLTLGVDASLDHIVPKSRGGSEDVSNLQWVYNQVNFMKIDMFENEFLNLVELIHENLAKKAS
ncbi:MAG: hypothetical protein M0R80_01585 [Proteobacteria bacterium]|nr:hypothetical protein [Pseudomonadota bacterium]